MMAQKDRTFQLFSDGKVIENSAQKRSHFCFEGVCKTFISNFPRFTTLAKGKQCKTWSWNILITIYVNNGICCIQSWNLMLKSPWCPFYDYPPLHVKILPIRRKTLSNHDLKMKPYWVFTYDSISGEKWIYLGKLKNIFFVQIQNKG